MIKAESLMLLWLNICFDKSIILWNRICIFTRLRLYEWHFNLFWFLNRFQILFLKLSKVHKCCLLRRLWLFHIKLFEHRWKLLLLQRFCLQRLLRYQILLQEFWKVRNCCHLINWTFSRIRLWIFFITEQIPWTGFKVVKIKFLWLHTLSHWNFFDLERERWVLHPKSSKSLLV